MKKILGIDYGLKNIGLALASEEEKLVLPWDVLENKNKEYVLKELERICQEEEISQIVIGWPQAKVLKKKKNKQLEEVKSFIQDLSKIKIPLTVFDERLTTKMADKLLKDTKISRDALAAMIILEDYLKKNK